MKEIGMAKRELEFTTRLTREDVAGVIEALIEGLKDGHLKIQKSNEVLELEVPRVVDLEVEAKVDDERAEFEIEVSWRTNRAENPDNAPDAPQASGDDAPKAQGKKTAAKGAAKKKPAAGSKTVKTPAKSRASSASGNPVGQQKDELPGSSGTKDGSAKPPAAAKKRKPATAAGKKGKAGEE